MAFAIPQSQVHWIFCPILLFGIRMVLLDQCAPQQPRRSRQEELRRLEEQRLGHSQDVEGHDS